MLIRRTLIALASFTLIGLGIAGNATPVHAVEVLNCTNPSNTVQLSGGGPFDFDNDPAYTCQEVTVVNSTVNLSDIKVFADLNGDGIYTTDISANVRLGYVNAQAGVQITYTGPSPTSDKIIVDFKKNISGTPSQRFEISISSPTPTPAITGVSPSTGPEAGGTSVTISGTDLDNASSVTFGGNAAASFTVDDSTQITATTPAGTAGAVDVVVTTPGGDDTSVGAFTYTAPAPDPTPTPATPPSAPESGDVEPGSGAVTVSWEPPATQGSFPVTNYQVQSTPGSAGCLVAATQRQCTVSGLTNGRSYSFQVRALNGGGWGPWADAGSATPVAPAEATILISGTRGDVRGKPGIIVTGTTTGLTEGSTLHPWIRLDGQRSSRMGQALITLDASGEFTWQRRVNRNIDVQIRSADGSVRSQELRITVR